MAESFFFDKKQRSCVGEALGIAETLAGNYFGVDLEDVDQFPYDLMTLANLQGMEKTRDALAQVCKYVYSKKRSAATDREFYRICLQDDRILYTVKTEISDLLQPLLLYVITHEVIHVIRFSMDPGRFHFRLHERKSEEREVHRITYECLKSCKDAQLDPLLERYRPLWDLRRTQSVVDPLTMRAGVPNF